MLIRRKIKWLNVQIQNVLVRTANVVIIVSVMVQPVNVAKNANVKKKNQNKFFEEYL